MGSCRSWCRPVVAVGSDRIRRRDAFYSAPIMSRLRGSRGRGHRVLRSGVFAAAAKDISDRGVDRRHGGGLCGGDVENGAGRAWRAGEAMYSVQLSGFVETRDIRERTDRFVLRVAQMEVRAARSNWNACGCRCGKAPRPRSAALLS